MVTFAGARTRWGGLFVFGHMSAHIMAPWVAVGWVANAPSHANRMETFTDMQWMGKFNHNIQLDTRINKWGGGVGPLLVME